MSTPQEEQARCGGQRRGMWGHGEAGPPGICGAGCHGLGTAPWMSACPLSSGVCPGPQDQLREVMGWEGHSLQGSHSPERRRRRTRAMQRDASGRCSGAGSWGGCVEHNEGEVGRPGRGQHSVLRGLDRILGHVTAVKWGRRKDCSGAKEGPSWRGGGLKKVPGVQASPGRPLEMLVWGQSRRAPPWSASLGVVTH